MSTLHAPRGMVCSIDHLASSAGLGMLIDGGSAADAAVAAAAVLAVTGPHVCGMGGDLWAVVHPSGAAAPVALDASGRAGSGADPERLRAEGHRTMPFLLDVRSVTVPGCVDGWLALHERFGRLPLARVLARAIGYAEDGFPASPLLAWSHGQLAEAQGAAELLSQGPLRTGAPGRRRGVGRALRAIVEEGRAGFYEGEFGAGLLAIGDGEFVDADLARPTGDWVAPVVRRAFEHDVWSTPPASQGYLTLLGAAIAEGLPLPDDPDDGAWAHLLVESARVAAHDRPARLHEGFDASSLLADDEVARRRGLVGPDGRADLPAPGAAGDTTYLCAGDADGTAVSLIQSNAKGYGSLLFEPATGIGLHNRGTGFNLVPGHPAEYGPGRRPPHTLCPAIVTRPDGTLRAAVGTMGGDGQPQVLLQVLCRFLRHGASPASAIDAARWVLLNDSGFDTWTDPDAARLKVEPAAPESWLRGLEARGHRVDVAELVEIPAFGHAHLLAATDTGWAAAADPRALTGSASGV